MRIFVNSLFIMSTVCQINEILMTSLNIGNTVLNETIYKQHKNEQSVSYDQSMNE